MWFVYILKCSDGSLYTGITRDVAKRIRVHSSGKGSAYVRSHLPVKLVYRKKYPNRSAASKCEAEIKSWPRRDKLVLTRK